MRRLAPALALVLLAAACAEGSASKEAASGSTGPSSSPGTAVAPAPGALANAACSIPHRQLVRIWRGTDPERSGQIVFVPQEPNYVGTNFPHSGPWDYLQDVPLLWYGPGIIPALGSVERPVTLADVAPSQAKLLGFDFDAPDGHPLEEVPEPDVPPRLIVTLVWDAGGRSVLDAYPNDWPVLRSLIDKGIWFDRANVGSSPSITPATHATIGTGAFPMHTGQTDAEFRLGNDLVRAGALGPVLMMEPTLADLYDRSLGNEPLVGALASVTWHLNMASHGSLWGGGDRDIAVLRVPVDADNEGAEGKEWNLQGRYQPFYRFPPYVNDLPPLSAYTDRIDRQDGALDGKWRDNSIAQLEEGWATPARIPYQGRMVEEVVAREGFGKDDVPDLLFINSKAIDHVSHMFSVNSLEMRDTLAWQDEDLGRFVRFLNQQVGRGRYVLIVTADHGAQFDPEVSGAFQLTPPELERDLNAAFPVPGGKSVFQAVRSSQIYLNEDVLAGSGYTPEQISRFILDYTEAQGTPDGSPPPPASEAVKRVFSAALPISMLPQLPCLPEARSGG